MYVIDSYYLLSDVETSDFFVLVRDNHCDSEFDLKHRFLIVSFSNISLQHQIFIIRKIWIYTKLHSFLSLHFISTVINLFFNYQKFFFFFFISFSIHFFLSWSSSSSSLSSWNLLTLSWLLSANSSSSSYSTLL